MFCKNFLEQLSVRNQCKKYGLSLWQCPQFLFIIMGIVIIVSSIVTFFIADRYIKTPEAVVLIVLTLSVILFIISFLIIQGFEKLAEAYRMKTEFISIISHQLRSPLSNLKLTIDLLMSGRLGRIEKKQTEYFEILKDNSTRMQEMVSNLLIVSRIETEKSFLKEQEFSFIELVSKTIKSFEVYAKSSNVEINFNFQKNLPNIFADPLKIQLVVENFLDNAIKYTQQKGKINIKIELRNDKIYFETEDNGLGILEEDQKYIFQKFFRGENASKKQTQGSGLGLHIAKAIIEKSKGRIGFKSKKDKGSTFWFILPIKTGNIKN